MRTSEFVRFVSKRAKSDTPLAFACRMARFGVIAPYMGVRSYHSQKINKLYSGCILKKIQGSNMYLDLEDEGLSHDLLLDGIREPYITKVIQRELHKDDICVDIGANIGYYVLQEARLAKKVYAIEPVQESVELLQRNIAVNKYQNVEVYRMACGDKDTKGTINVSSKRNWSSMFPSNGRDYLRQDEIGIVTLDTFLMDKPVPTFIRMDVEGYEYEIILGMIKLLESGKPLKMFIEMHFDILRMKTIGLAKILRNFGFEVSCASIEPHPAIARYGMGKQVVRWLEKGIGAQTGYVKVTLDDFIHKREYSSGQIEYLEVLFERK